MTTRDEVIFIRTTADNKKRLRAEATEAGYRHVQDYVETILFGSVRPKDRPGRRRKNHDNPDGAFPMAG